MDELTRDLEVYLVGGAVRDELLGLPVKDRDYVVVGVRPAELEKRGFMPVGRDFPVFLHPRSKEQYALARTERKTAPGYHGFRFDTSPEVTLEQDLERRDLTINAMARARDGTLVDPWGGARDLERGLLRHVSPAFAEDPVRVLRVARFAARYAGRGFRVADDTMQLMRRMVDDEEVDALVAERVWVELEGALTEPTPSRFVAVLRECGALARVMPELDRLFGVPQPRKYHPEIDTGIHTLMVVDMAASLSDDPLVRFAALVHDLGKGETPAGELPRHVGHENNGVPVIERLCERLRVPRRYRELAVATCRVHLRVTRIQGLRPARVLETLEIIDAFRRPERVRQVALACEADARGRKGLENRAYPQRALMQRCYEAAAEVDTATVAAGRDNGAAIGEAIRERRIEAISGVLKKEKEAGG